MSVESIIGGIFRKKPGNSEVATKISKQQLMEGISRQAIDSGNVVLAQGRRGKVRVTEFKGPLSISKK